MTALDAIDASFLAELLDPRPIEEYHEDMGTVLWWKFPITEPPYVGTPNDCGREVVVHFDVSMHTMVGQIGEDSAMRLSRMVGGWPGYHTHFTPLPTPQLPRSAS